MAGTMRAVAVFPSRRAVEIVDHPVPERTTPAEARLRILDVGVCGTDKEICAFEYGVPPEGAGALVIGHESLAEVIEVGPGVTSLRPGDLVVPMVRRPCAVPTCSPCREGRQDFCATGAFSERGIKQAHGYLTEEIVDDERYLVPVPRALREVGVLVEPLTVAEKALQQLRAVQSRLPWGDGHTAAVVGAGPVGLLGAMALRARGFETTVWSREPEDSPRASLVRSFGAQFVSAAGTDAEGLAQRMGRIDVVYEAVGVPSLVFDVARFLAPNGVLITTGVPAQRAPIPVEASRILRQMVLGNQVLIGSVNCGRDGFEAAVRDLATFTERWPGAVRGLITGRFPMDSYRDLLLGHAPGIKHVFAVAPEARP